MSHLFHYISIRNTPGYSLHELKVHEHNTVHNRLYQNAEIIPNTGKTKRCSDLNPSAIYTNNPDG